ncbi:MAG: SdpI family protein [Acholeplasmatales bacterium]|jgi:hypothetical protein|nr:SdpI family protein [Acholeplasmatales bacterium]
MISSNFTPDNYEKMLFLIFIFFIVILPIPIIKIVLGSILYFKTPKMNRYFGFRTKKAYFNDDTWFYSNNLFGKIFFYSGIIETILFIPLIIFIMPFTPWIFILLEMVTAITSVVGVIVVNIKLGKLISQKYEENKI